MGFLYKLFYKRIMKKAEKANTALTQELFEKMNTNEDVRKNCAEELMGIVRPLINIALIEHKEKTCNAISIIIDTGGKCAITINGSGIDGNILKTTPLSVFETINSESGEEFVGNFLMKKEAVSEPFSESANEEESDDIFDETTIIGNLKSAILHCDYFEIISEFQKQKYIKKYIFKFDLPKFKSCGKTEKSGLTIIFNSNLLKNYTFGFDEISSYSEQIAQQNFGMKINIDDKRNNRQAQYVFTMI